MCKLRRVMSIFFTAAIVMLFAFTHSAAAKPIVYVGDFKDNAVSVIDIGIGKVIATIPVETGPHGMCLSLDGKLLFVSSDGSSKVNVIDAATNKVSSTITVGKSPHGLALTPDGKMLLVCVNGDDKIAFVDTQKLALISSVSIGKPHTISVRPDGKVAYVSSQEVGNFKLAVIDLMSKKLLRTIPLSKTPRDMEFSYDGKAVLFTEAGINAVEVLDPVSDKIVAEIPTGASPHYVNIFKGQAGGLAVVQGPGEIQLFDPMTYKPGAHIKVGTQPHWLSISSDAKTAFVTNEGSNDLSVIDLQTGKVTTTIPVGNQPRKVVAQPTTSPSVSDKVSVSISNFSFVPPTAKVNAGESVTWKNDDGSPHAIAFKDGSEGSETIFPGGAYNRKFDKPGVYNYFCSIHNYMTGKVEVIGK